MDQYISPNTYNEISQKELPELWRHLKSHGVTSIQFKRMIRPEIDNT